VDALLLRCLKGQNDRQLGLTTSNGADFFPAHPWPWFSFRAQSVGCSWAVPVLLPVRRSSFPSLSGLFLNRRPAGMLVMMCLPSFLPLDHQIPVWCVGMLFGLDPRRLELRFPCHNPCHFFRVPYSANPSASVTFGRSVPVGS